MLAWNEEELDVGCSIFIEATGQCSQGDLLQEGEECVIDFLH